MDNIFFGKLDFDMGWKAKTKIKFFDKDYTVTLKASAYFEKDGVTVEQENSYADYLKNRNAIYESIKRQLKEYAGDGAAERFVPRTLLFERDGSYALLCDDKEMPDEGIAICLSPEEKILSQDDYL